MALHASSPVGSTKKVRKMNIYTPPPPERKSAVRADQIDLDDPAAFVLASWARVIEFAPIENKLTLLFMMARDAATWADAHRQLAIDDVWYVAGELGLIDKFGTVHCQNILAAAFDRKIP